MKTYILMMTNIFSYFLFLPLLVGVYLKYICSIFLLLLQKRMTRIPAPSLAIFNPLCFHQKIRLKAAATAAAM